MSDPLENTVAERFEAYLLGRLDGAAMDQLEADLRDDPRHADDCIAVMATLAMVREQFRDRREQAGELTRDPTLQGFHDLLADLSAMEDTAESETVQWVGQVQTAKPIWRQWQFVIPSAIAALLALAVVLIVAIPSSNTTTTNPPITNDLSEPGRDGPAHSQPAANPIVATLTAEHDAVWDRRPGEDLYAGQKYELIDGFAEVTTARGAVAIFEAPARFELLGNPNAIRLHNGKLVGLCETASSKGFLVLTDSADVVDLGTEFGVEAIVGVGTFTQVMDGEVSLTPSFEGIDSGHRSSTPLFGGQAASVVTGAEEVVHKPYEKHRFVDHQTFAALIGEMGLEARKAATRDIWQRNRSLIAVEIFEPIEQGRLSYGWRPWPASIKGEYKVVPISPRVGTKNTLGGQLHLSSADNTDIYLDIDLSSGSPALESGVLTEDGRWIGRDGSRVCLAWTTTLEQGLPTQEGVFGLSLFADGNTSAPSEMLFIGDGAHGVDWVAQICKTSIDSARISDPNESNVDIGRISPGQHDRWIVVIDFVSGPDRIAIYRNPEGTSLDGFQPDAVISNIDLVFDRLRLSAGNGTSRWSIADLRIGTTVESVITD